MLANTGLRVPNFTRGIGRARHEVNSLPIDVNAPDSTVVAIIGAKAFAINRKPNVWLLVFGSREEKITLTVVFDLRDGTLVALQ
jgi:hypothetical protein